MSVRKKRKKRTKPATHPPPPELLQPDSLVEATPSSLNAEQIDKWFREAVDDEFHHKLASERPIVAEFRRAIFFRVSHVARVWSAAYPGTLEYKLGVFEKAAQDVTEIISWLVPPGTPPSANPPFSISDYMNEMIRKGFSSFEEMVAVNQFVNRPRIGRPVSRREMAVRALEAKRTRGLSWTRLAREFCVCDQPEHDARCTDRLRRQVRVLQAFLDRLSREENV